MEYNHQRPGDEQRPKYILGFYSESYLGYMIVGVILLLLTLFAGVGVASVAMHLSSEQYHRSQDEAAVSAEDNPVSPDQSDVDVMDPPEVNIFEYEYRNNFEINPDADKSEQLYDYLRENGGITTTHLIKEYGTSVWYTDPFNANPLCDEWMYTIDLDVIFCIDGYDSSHELVEWGIPFVEDDSYWSYYEALPDHAVKSVAATHPGR